MSEPNGKGHNGGAELTSDERRALSFHHYRAIAAQKERLVLEQAEYKRLRKLAKADGIVLSDIDFMLKCAEIEDGNILTDRIRREAEILEWFSLAKQGDLFEDLSREPAIEKAARDGEATGFLGKDASSPYGAGSEQDQAWMAGWHRAQAKMRDDLAAAMEKTNAAKAIEEDADDDDGEDVIGAVSEAAE